MTQDGLVLILSLIPLFMFLFIVFVWLILRSCSKDSDELDNNFSNIAFPLFFIVLPIIFLLVSIFGVIAIPQNNEQETTQTSIVSVYPEDNNSAPANNMFCSSCGKQVEKDYNNCPYCGESLINARDEVKTSVVVIYPENDNNVSDCQKANK
ncbi:MAG: zinc ribbon domain-containing protein [Bacteroidales bacterium]|nr:zinc ribbon domain-containing protein [Bacteroidales bacterium]